MKILSIKIPQFKALKNIDLTFDKNFSVQAFLIGGLNGSGKSTLIQIVFILLHKFMDNDFEKVYAPRIISGLPKPTEPIINIAIIEILIDELNVKLSFHYLTNPNKIGIEWELIKDGNIINLPNDHLKEIFIKISKNVFLITPKDVSLLFDHHFKRNKSGVFDKMYSSNLFTYTDYINLNMLRYSDIIDDIKEFSLINSPSVVDIDTTGRIKLLTDEVGSGELKRFIIYYLLKHRLPKDSVILMDNIEDSFHPRIQRCLIDDITEWNDSQYILATHSYEICRGVPFGNIYEI